MYGRVLVTGAGGFIGSHVVAQQLSLGREVSALDIRLSGVDGMSDRALTRIEADFTEPAVQREALDGIDLVIHLASAHLEVSVPAETYWRVNVEALPGFLAASRDAGVRRFVHVSSVGVYGEIEQPPADEDSPCRPELLYERTKHAGELEVKKFFDETGFPIVIVRPAWVYGPGCPRTGKLFRSIRKGRFFYAGDGETLRHCVYIDDFVDALELSATQEAAVGRTYIVGDRQPVTLKHLMSEISRVSGKRPPRLHVPLWLMNGLGLLAEAAFYPLRREPPLSRRTMRFFTGNTAFDTSRAQRELGFVPKFDVGSGMRAYADWLSS
jgi:nucleoside-diphosphate-sugar epimerase